MPSFIKAKILPSFLKLKRFILLSEIFRSATKSSNFAEKFVAKYLPIGKSEYFLYILQVFPSVEAANRYLGKQPNGHIAAVCRGKRQTAYGYKWKYAEK